MAIRYNKDYFGLRWLCAHFDISPNCYYNYLEDEKCGYHEQRDAIYERIKYIFYNLKQNFVVDEKNKVWCTDFTYMRQPNGKFRYNGSIIDLFDRSVVASINDNYINTELATKTLKTALKKENPSKGLILHSNQGVQFASWEFVILCKEHGVTQSMSKAVCPYDNVPMERF